MIHQLFENRVDIRNRGSFANFFQGRTHVMTQPKGLSVIYTSSPKIMVWLRQWMHGHVLSERANYVRSQSIITTKRLAFTCYTKQIVHNFVLLLMSGLRNSSIE